MGVKRSVPNGDNGFVKIDFEEFKGKLKKQGLLGTEPAVKLMNQYFPEEYRREVEEKNEAVLRRRWNAWFSEESKEVSRRQIILKPEESHIFGSDFLIANNGHARLLAKAKQAALSEYKGVQRNRVTDFSGWLYRLEHPSNPISMRAGHIGERNVQYAKRFRVAPRIFDFSWAPFFFDDFTKAQESLKSSSLLVNGTPIYGKPDYVFFNESTKTALIVEVKMSATSLQGDAWPNLRAQLWAYAHLDLLVNKAQNIILIGEVWCDMGKNCYGRRKTFRWDLSDTEFYRENQSLFKCFQDYASS